MGLSCYHGDELVSSEVDVVPQRQFTLQEIDLLGRATGFEVRRLLVGVEEAWALGVLAGLKTIHRCRLGMQVHKQAVCQHDPPAIAPHPAPNLLPACLCFHARWWRCTATLMPPSAWITRRHSAP